MVDTGVTVLTVCAPLFAMVVFGILLKRSGALTDDAHRFISGLVYRFSLPVLIFTGICKADFVSLLNPAVVVGTLGGTAILVAFCLAGAWLLPSAMRGPAITVSYLSNLSYMGFPLAKNAFGDDGLVYAGIVNAFTMPVFVVAGVLILSMGRQGTGSLWTQIKTGLLNPVVLAAFGGLAVSLFVHETGLGGVWENQRTVHALVGIVGAILVPIASVGLPLSLIAVGASLRFSHVRQHWGLLTVSGFLKLVAAPLVTLILCRVLFPGADRAAVGTAVLLMACPVAVALYVMSQQFDAEPEFVAGALAMSTAVSCITIPLWVAIVL